MKLRTAAALAASALLAVTLAPAADAANPLPGAAQRELTVTTYNIYHGVGEDGALDLPRIARVLEGTGAQVIGLQEVDNHWGTRSDFVDQAARLAQLLRMDVCYSANLDQAPAAGQTHRRQYGTAILSAFTLSNCSSTPLPNHPGGEQRGLAQADLTVPGVPVRFYNTHLTHTSSEGRLAQAEVINRIVAADDRVSILVGDLNATPESPEYPTFTAELSDVWPAVGEGPGYTIGVLNPNRRIDYVLVDADVTPLSARVVPSLASDHLPVTAKVRLPQR